MFNTSQLQYFELQIKECNRKVHDNSLPETEKRYFLGQRDAYINILNMWEKRNIVDRIINQSYQQVQSVDNQKQNEKENNEQCQQN